MNFDYRHWGVARQIGISGNTAVDDVDEPTEMQDQQVVPWHYGRWGPRKQYEYLRSFRNPNIRQRGLNADLLDGYHGSSFVRGPATSTICNLPCFADEEGGEVQDTGISSADVLTTERDNATPALADKFGFGDTDDNGDPKTATLSDLKTALGVGGGDVVGPASATDSDVVLFDTTSGKLIKDSGISGPDLLTKSGNLSGIADAGTARSNIGAGTGDGDVTGPGPTVTDQGFTRFNGTGGLTIEASGFKEGSTGVGAGASPNTITLEAIAQADKGVSIIITPAAAVGTNRDGGDIVLDGSAATGSGTAGKVLVGTSSPTSAITIGRSGIEITANGGLVASAGFGGAYEAITSSGNTIADASMFVRDTAGTGTTSLPASPRTLHTLLFSNEAKGNVSLGGNGNNINGAASLTVVAGTRYWVTWSGSQWEAMQV